MGACAELEARLAGSLRAAPRYRRAGAGRTGSMSVPSSARPPASYVSSHLSPGGSLGITWGGTINTAAQNMHRPPQVRATPSCCCAAALARSTAINPYDNAAMFAARSTPPATT